MPSVGFPLFSIRVFVRLEVTELCRSQLLRYSHTTLKSGKTQVEELKSLRKIKPNTWTHVALILQTETESM